MARTSKLNAATITFATLAVCATAALAYRIWRASDFGPIEALTSAGTGGLVAAACSTGWLIRVRNLRARAESAEWQNARLRRAETLLDGDEDKELWDCVPPAGNNEDTCAFGTSVHVLSQYRQRWRQQAG